MVNVLQAFPEYTRKLVQKIPIDLGNYPYVCARVKAKKSLLYPPDIYQKFLNMSMPQISRTLGEGEYREEILALGVRLSGVDLIEMATNRNLAKTYKNILNFSEGHLKNIVSKYIDRWDVLNIQTIIRGKFYGAERKEIIEDIVAAGSLTTEFLHELVEKETIDEVIEALKDTPYYQTLIELKKENKETTNSAIYDDALVRRYYKALLETTQSTNVPNRHFLRFIKMEIDMLNLRTLLRLNTSKAEIKDDMFLEGGLELSPGELKNMIKMDWGTLVTKLKKYSFYDTVSDELSKVEEKGLNDVMRSLEKHVLGEASKHANLYPLSILPILDYIVAKKNEVDNIRIIARGKESGLNNEVIRNLLVT